MKIYLCCIGRLENNYILEFVNYYQSIGIDKIILFDNNYDGEEYFEDILQEHINNNFIEVINYRNKEACQIYAYDECYKKYSNECDWICFFDIDEFLILEDKYKNIKEFLSDKIFDKCDGIRICWKNFDDNDLITINNNYSCLNRFHRWTAQTHCKTIFRTKNNFVNFGNKYISDAHGCYDKNLIVVSADGNICDNYNNDVGNKPIYKNAWLNHYRYKTLEEFIKFKLFRGYPDRPFEYTKSKGFGINTFFYANKKTKEKLEYIKSLGLNYE